MRITNKINPAHKKKMKPPPMITINNKMNPVGTNLVETRTAKLPWRKIKTMMKVNKREFQPRYTTSDQGNKSHTPT